MHFGRPDLISGRHFALKFLVQGLAGDAEEIELPAPDIGTTYMQANFNEDAGSDWEFEAVAVAVCHGVSPIFTMSADIRRVSHRFLHESGFWVGKLILETRFARVNRKVPVAGMWVAELPS
jgi:hypothetical protein